MNNNTIKKFLKRLHKYDINNESLLLLLKRSDELNQLLEITLNSIPYGLLVSDRRYKLRFYNRRAMQLVLKPKKVTTTSSVWTFIRNARISAFLQKTLLEDQVVGKNEFSIVLDRQRIVLECSVFPLGHKGIIRGSLFIVEDVTEKRRIYAKLRRMQGLASFSTLASGIAHEVKNPLSAISIHMQLMQRILSQQNISETSKPELTNHLDVVLQELTRLSQLINDYLEVSKPFQLNPSRQNLNKLIEEVVSLVGKELETKNIRLLLYLELSLPDLWLDDKLIKTALINLIKNSQESMEGRAGEITITTIFNREDKVLLLVSDTGSGMEYEVKHSVFDPYFTTKQSGTGLGLTLVSYIMEEHGGEISFTSTLGKGTIFTLTFPLKSLDQKLLSEG